MTTDDAAQIDRWLEAARQGDERATHQLLEYCRPLIRRYLQGRVRREEDCHDLTQEVLIRVARALPHLTLRASFEHWLMRLAANCLSRFYSRRWHALEIPFSDLPDPEWLSEVQQENGCQKCNKNRMRRVLLIGLPSSRLSSSCSRL